MPEVASVPAVPRPAASVVIVREAGAGEPEPLEVWMIRRHESMKFLGGYYAFPGGRVDAADAAPEALASCHGVSTKTAEATFPGHAGDPALAFWIAAVRELLEESGILLACAVADGRPIDGGSLAVRDLIARLRQELMAGTPLPTLLAREGWRCDLRGLRYLSHFITPPSSPIRFTARFFLCRAHDQPPALFTEETSEAFWIHPGEGYRRFVAGEMKMAEPAEYGLAYLSQFNSLDELWAAHADGRHKFHGVGDRIPGARRRPKGPNA